MWLKCWRAGRKISILVNVIAAQKQKGNSTGVCAKCTTGIHGVVCEKSTTTGISNKVSYFEDVCAFLVDRTDIIGANKSGTVIEELDWFEIEA